MGDNMFCPECGKRMFKKNMVWECPSCGYTFIKNDNDNVTNSRDNDFSNKINDFRESNNKMGKVIDGIGNVAEHVSIQVKKEEAYIKNRNNEDSTVLVDNNDLILSKVILDGVDFVNTKKQERDEAKKVKNIQKKEKKESEKIKKQEEKVKRGKEKVKQEKINRPDDALFYIDGREGTIAIFDEFIQLDFTGSMLKQYLSRMGGIKKIYYPQINSIQKRDAGDFILGSLEFEVPGMSYSGSGGGKSENIIHYSYYYQEEADKIFEFVNQKILNIQKNKANPQSNTSNESTISELKKAKELLDMGAITQEEFNNIKKDLLN